ncbi:DMT family transporter [Candidatus Latescibacterota bacterium]
MSFRRYARRADILMITACFLWAAGTVLSKNAFGMEPDSFRVDIFNGLRFPIATALLFITLKLSGSNVSIQPKHIPGFAAVSFFGMFLFIVLFHHGLAETTASNTGIIMAAIPLTILIISFIAGVEKLDRWLISGIVVGLCGVILMNVQSQEFTFGKGVSLVFLSCFSWGIYAVYGEKYMCRYSPMVTIAWIFLFTSLYHIPLIMYQLSEQSWGSISGSNWFNLGFAAVVPLFIANTIYFSSIQKMGASHSGIYIYLEPVFTVILAYVIRNERISFLHFIGFAVIIAGVSISRMNRNRKKQSKC